jgi:hypothetical protein
MSCITLRFIFSYPLEDIRVIFHGLISIQKIPNQAEDAVNFQQICNQAEDDINLVKR